MPDERRASASPLVERDRARGGDVQRLGTAGEGDGRGRVAAGDDLLGEPFPLGSEDEDRPVAEVDPVERLTAVRDEGDAPAVGPG